MAGPDPGSLRTRRQALLVAVLGLLVLAMIGIGILAWPAVTGLDRRAVAASGPAISAAGAQGTATRLEMLLGMQDRTWSGLMRRGLGREYEPPRRVLTTRPVASPCGDGRRVSGPFHCSEDRVLVLDLVFFERLKHWLGHRGPQGLALITAHLSARQVQWQLGAIREARAYAAAGVPSDDAALALALALQRDCYAGVLAALTAAQIGPVPAGRYGHAISAAREVQARMDHARPGTVVLHDLRLGALEAREAAFRHGYDAQSLGDCQRFGPDG